MNYRQKPVERHHPMLSIQAIMLSVVIDVHISIGQECKLCKRVRDGNECAIREDNC